MPMNQGNPMEVQSRFSQVIRRLGFLLLALSVCVPAVAQSHPAHPAHKAATLMSGFGDLSHPVTTASPEAQKYFDQGLRLIYAFNHDEATRSFQHAADLDPKMAMAYWGLAEAVGPNYNDPASDERFQQAHELIQKALDLSANASASEEDYILAMAKRFPVGGADRRKAAEDYRDAMRELMNKYPDDLDAATLFAESSMNLHPWGLWMRDGTPHQGTDEIVATLESVLKRDPNHMGAVHYYIHAVEASRSPERALAGANRLAALAPSAGHLVHMPAHVYIRTGDYALAALTNEKAAAADRAYIQARGGQGLYPAMYYSHNLHFIACVASMSGNYAEAKKAADMLAVHVGPLVKAMPPLEAFMTIPLAVNLRFHRWEDVLKAPQPHADMKITTTYWHFARGMALAGTGKVSEAETEYKAVAAVREATPPDAIFAMPFNNRTKDILLIATDVLGARIATAKKDYPSAIGMLQEAVAVQDKLNYGEPPDWFSPVRESLGAALLMNGAAADAEKIFREDLDRNPRNPRSLFGLQQTLKAQKRDYDAGLVEKQLHASWKGGNTQLRMADLI
jgi:tetratricopeptide (TPR) repeat protein